MDFFCKGEEGKLFFTFTFFPVQRCTTTLLVRLRRCLEIRKVEREREEGGCFYRNGFRARFGGKRVESVRGSGSLLCALGGEEGPFKCHVARTDRRGGGIGGGALFKKGKGLSRPYSRDVGKEVL